jgi:FMN phosphatase YigB (HAD superfamily)
LTVFLDIGSTLIDGPPSGPGARIATELGLGAETAPLMNEILFKTDAPDSSDLAIQIANRFGTYEKRTCEVLEQIWTAQLGESYVIPGAPDAIESLRSAGIARVYVSNIWRPFYRRFEQAFPFEAATQPCFPSFRTQRLKPDARLLSCICRDVGVSPRDVVMVGDTWIADMAPAIESGMATIWTLHRPAKEKQDLIRILNGMSTGPDVTLGSIAELNADTARQAQEIHLRGCA